MTSLKFIFKRAVLTFMQIWRLCYLERLVFWGPGNISPGFLLANKESRRETNGIQGIAVDGSSGNYTKIVRPLPHVRTLKVDTFHCFTPRETIIDS